MEDKNYTIKQRRDGYYVLTPDKGHVMTNGKEYRSKVVTKQPDEWWAVEE